MYEIGQNICLWQIENRVGDAAVYVLKEVAVTINEIKTGVPGEFSKRPVSAESLRGVGDDGKIYEKHWEFWPESQTNDFIDQWSMRDDAEGDFPFWIPKEALHIYNAVSRKRSELKLLDKTGKAKPKGDVVYCEKHDCYSYSNNKCFRCVHWPVSRRTLGI